MNSSVVTDSPATSDLHATSGKGSLIVKARSASVAGLSGTGSIRMHRHIGCLGSGGMFALIVSGAGQKPWRRNSAGRSQICGWLLTRRKTAPTMRLVPWRITSPVAGLKATTPLILRPVVPGILRIDEEPETFAELMEGSFGRRCIGYL